MRHTGPVRALTLVAVLALVGAACASDTRGTVSPTGGGTAEGTPATQPTTPAQSPTGVPRMTVPSFLDLRTGETRPLPAGIPQGGRAYAVSPDGTMVATSPCCHPPNPVWVANIDGTGMREITPEGVDGFFPRWSPDGSKLVYQERDAATQELGALVVIDVATGKRTTVIDLKPKRIDGGWWVAPSFTPDGDEILLALPRGSEADAPWGLWLVPVAGGEPRPAGIKDAVAWDFFGDPPGSHFAYVDSSGALIEADWSSLRNPRVLRAPRGDAGLFRGSPDGTRIVYLEGDEVHVLDTATGEDSLVARGDWPEWFDNDTLIIVPAT